MGGFGNNANFGFGGGGDGGGGSVTGAINGLSLNDALNVVLGQEFGNPENPAVLTSSRQIPMDTFFVGFTTAAGSVNILDRMLLVDGSSDAGLPAVVVSDTNILQSITITLEPAQVRSNIIFASDDSGASVNIGVNQVTITDLNFSVPATGAMFEVTSGGIATQQPSANGSGIWKLGKAQAGTVLLDTANYVELEIDGALYLLATVTIV